MPVSFLHGVTNFAWFVWKTNVNVVQSLLCTKKYLKTVSLLLGSNYFSCTLNDCRYKLPCPLAFAPVASNGMEAKMHCLYFFSASFFFKENQIAPADVAWRQFNFDWSRRGRVLLPFSHIFVQCEYSRSSAVFQNACWCFYSLVELMKRVEILFIVDC